MRHFIIASHGPLSAAILKSASLIAGEDIFRRFACIQVAMEDSGDRIRQICEGLFAGWEAEDEGIALTDVIGGNVANILMECQRSNPKNYRVFPSVRCRGSPDSRSR